MRTVLIGTVVCLTAGTFFGAERLISSNAEVVALEQQEAIKAAVKTQLEQSNAGFVAEIAALKKAGASSTAQIATLNSSVETLTAKRDELALQLITAQDEAASSLDRLGEVEAMYTGMVDQTDAQKAEMAEKEQELEALRAEVASAPEDAQLAEQVAVLTNQIKARDQLISSLTGAVKAAKAAQPEIAPQAEAVDAALNAAAVEELADAKAQISELTDTLDVANDTLSARDETIAALEAELSAAKATAETDVVETVAVPSADQEEQLAQISALDAQIAELTQVVEDQNSAIANLRLGFGDGPVEPMEMAEVCIARASGILESTQITFGTGTSSISSGSIATLESLRDLAIGCKNDKVVIEIGGHTDSFGAESANQALSEARAESVKKFLADRGIAPENMIAIGYGESNPVASNDTPEGRAANRRITFMWQMREPEVVEPEVVEPAEYADPVEPVSDTVDG